jgi:hypothetical protein
VPLFAPCLPSPPPNQGTHHKAPIKAPMRAPMPAPGVDRERRIERLSLPTVRRIERLSLPTAPAVQEGGLSGALITHGTSSAGFLLREDYFRFPVMHFGGESVL